MANTHGVSLRLVSLFLLGMLWTASSVSASERQRYEVTVTNLTRGQNLTPAIVATHDRDLRPLFQAGEAASAALIALAEDADVRPLRDALADDPHVRDVVVLHGTAAPPLPDPPGGVVIRPGESASVRVAFGGRAQSLSLVGMLATTNDAFYALNGVAGPRHGSVTYYAVAWDAGSEANNEQCPSIPGPPCRHFFVRVPAGAEGFVHVHAGIHGVGHLVPATHDWRNPVAKITIRRVSHDRDASHHE